MTPQDHIFERGRVAGYNGKQRDCPYHEYSDNGESWTSGYERGELERLAEQEVRIRANCGKAKVNNARLTK